MDSINLWGWAAIAVAAYLFSKTFRREVNGWIVKIADKIKHDTPHTQPQETHLLEDVAFMMFEKDYPNDPRIAAGWHNLPPDLRAVYIQKAISPLLSSEKKAVLEEGLKKGPRRAATMCRPRHNAHYKIGHCRMSPTHPW